MKKTSFKLVATTISASFVFVTFAPGASAATINQSCKKVGATSTAKSKGKTVKVKCSKAGTRLRWVQVKSTAKTPAIVTTPSTNAPVIATVPRVTVTPAVTVPVATTPTTQALVGTVSQRNAVSKAASYLRYSAFSRSGLISQLQYEGFSLEDSTYGVDAQKADWSAQAAKKAASYLKSSAFSRSGLVSQLEYEGFSSAESIYGVDAQKVDWNAQAAKKAASYLRYSSFSRSGLLDQLLYEGFSQAEAEYGVSTTGL